MCLLFHRLILLLYFQESQPVASLYTCLLFHRLILLFYFKEFRSLTSLYMYLFFHSHLIYLYFYFVFFLFFFPRVSIFCFLIHVPPFLQTQFTFPFFSKSLSLLLPYTCASFSTDSFSFFFFPTLKSLSLLLPYTCVSLSTDLFCFFLLSSLSLLLPYACAFFSTGSFYFFFFFFFLLARVSVSCFHIRYRCLLFCKLILFFIFYFFLFIIFIFFQESQSQSLASFSIDSFYSFFFLFYESRSLASLYMCLLLHRIILLILFSRVSVSCFLIHVPPFPQTYFTFLL